MATAKPEQRVIGAALSFYDEEKLDDRYKLVHATLFYEGDETALLDIMRSRDRAALEERDNNIYGAVHDVVFGDRNDIEREAQAILSAKFGALPHANISYHTQERVGERASGFGSKRTVSIQFEAKEPRYVGSMTPEAILQTSRELFKSACKGRLRFDDNHKLWALFESLVIDKCRTVTDGQYYWKVNGSFLEPDKGFIRRQKLAKTNKARRKSLGDLTLGDLQAVFRPLVDTLRPLFGEKLGNKLCFKAPWTSRLTKAGFYQSTPELHASLGRLKLAPVAAFGKALQEIAPFVSGMLKSEDKTIKAYGKWAKATLKQASRKDK